MGTTLDTIPANVPYLRADQRLVRLWRDRLGTCRGFRVGIGWQGNRQYRCDRFRSIPLWSFAPLAALPDVTLVSLQQGTGRQQLQAVPAEWGILDLGPEVDTEAGAFMDTAAIMANLDLVVTSDTAIAHLAGALGFPVWVALGKSADWRWLEKREDSPWYPTMRLFRQTQLGDWDEVFERIATQLRAVLDGETARLPPQSAALPEIHAPIGAGELLDRITILEIKSRRVSNPGRRRTAEYDLDRFVAVRDRFIRITPELEALLAELRAVNERLWDAEDCIRLCERQQDFGPRFVELARTIYLTNDQRSEIKRRINTLLGSSTAEEKDYPSLE